MKHAQEAESNVAAMKKEISDQAESYRGIIDEREDKIAEVLSAYR